MLIGCLGHLVVSTLNLIMFLPWTLPCQWHTDTYIWVKWMQISEQVNGTLQVSIYNFEWLQITISICIGFELYILQLLSRDGRDTYIASTISKPKICKDLLGEGISSRGDPICNNNPTKRGCSCQSVIILSWKIYIQWLK